MCALYCTIFNTMQTMPQITKSMKELLSKEEFKLPQTGDFLKGKILSISRSAIFVDLDSLGTGIVYPGEFYDNPNLTKELRAETEVVAVLLDLENEEGYRELSLKRAQQVSAWQDIENKKKEGKVIEIEILNINKGGLIAEINGVQGFLPLSQLSHEHYPKVEGGDITKIVQNLQKFKNQILKVKIIDSNEAENKLIISEKAIAEEAAKEELEKLKVGDVVEGEITEVTDFGAFIRLSNMLDGLIHSSEMDWRFVENPREIVKPGDKVKAKIIDIEGGRVSLSLKRLKDDPWEKIEEKYQVGQKIEGKIMKIKSTGVFVELPGDIIGLLPASEFDGKNPEDVVKTGESHQMAIVNIEPEEHRLLLTLEK